MLYRSEYRFERARFVDIVTLSVEGFLRDAFVVFFTSNSLFGLITVWCENRYFWNKNCWCLPQWRM